MSDTGPSSALDEFRVTWKRELENAENYEISSQIAAENEAEGKAEAYFQTAVDLEQRGKVYDALSFYRKATQIIPDIEFKCYERQRRHIEHVNYHGMHSDFNRQMELSSADAQEVNEPNIEGLYAKFQRDLCNDEIYAGKLLLNSRDANIISTGRNIHISDLPPEIIMHILRWVVSTQLDVRSLEQFSAVCKGFYTYARDEELWRMACLRVWGHNVGVLGEKHETWRDMFIKRERVHFHGCYISKTTYLRMGENSFQDQFYRPIQLVEYYRYIRFLPNGKVMMMTTADEPQQGVVRLKDVHNTRPDVLRGRYRLLGETVTLVMQKTQAKKQSHRHRRGSIMPADEDVSTQYIIEMRILSPKRRFVQLAWLSYTLVQNRNKVENRTVFDIGSSKYPALWFSPVKSYDLVADAPLAM
ncbi:CG5961 [Drosophila busckii]|uniref:CG5961 n=1 Tax=Drosophila busckii TaxID=30019 RepID=A0A0M3QY74_DROBS|nr:F-box only protein 9 [Drosophila busckii]XP_017849271.1 F-box only protein 9 [Drosophila busckii]ALC45252.1 CG5961 [Drosophila busckii]ALC47183.1 CG5961 [Drosophila busckii]